MTHDRRHSLLCPTLTVSRFLSEAGIDSVKTDAQFFIDDLEDADDRRRLIKTYQDAWMVSSLKWFSIKAISCTSSQVTIAADS